MSVGCPADRTTSFCSRTASIANKQTIKKYMYFFIDTGRVYYNSSEEEVNAGKGKLINK